MASERAAKYSANAESRSLIRAPRSSSRYTRARGVPGLPGSALHRVQGQMPGVRVESGTGGPRRVRLQDVGAEQDGDAGRAQAGQVALEDLVGRQCGVDERQHGDGGTEAGQLGEQAQHVRVADPGGPLVDRVVRGRRDDHRVRRRPPVAGRRVRGPDRYPEKLLQRRYVEEVLARRSGRDDLDRPPARAGQGDQPVDVLGRTSPAHHPVEEAREQVASALRARPSEVIFTAGGTESDNLAVKGIFWARRAADPARNRVVAGSVEHHAVLDAVRWLESHEGAAVSWLPVDPAGRVSPDALAAVLDDDVALVTAMWANNEVGTVQPVLELAAVAAVRRVPYHTDAVPAA